MERVPLSVIIITKNEERNIASCITSCIDWADEVIVVDDESSDNTVEVAKRSGASVLSRKMDIEGRHRNWAYSQARNKWVLSLDADEKVSDDLKEELTTLFKDVMEDDAYAIPIRTYIGKRWIRYGGWYPAGKIRLFKKSRFRYEETGVHPRVFIEGSYGRLTKDIIHYSYRDFHDFFQSLNNQTTLEAEKWFDERRKINFLKVCRKFIDRFLRSYIGKQGFRDGLLGFVVAYGGGLYQLMSYVKYKEMSETKNSKLKSQN